MKKLFLIVVVLSSLNAVAQNKSTVETRALMQNYNASKSVGKMSKTLLDRYPLREGKGGASIGVIAKVNDGFSAAELESQGIKITSRINDIVVMRAPIEKLECIERCKGVTVFSVAHRVAPLMDKTRADTHTDSVQAGVGVPMPFDGEGVLIGITDWGFDYTHPNLNKSNNLRIERAWDHFKTSGPAPDGFDYGTEYRTPAEVRAAKCDTFGLYGYGTHGTHVAGICGGNGTTSGHAIGQAPGAHYLMGSWFLDEASWLDQVAWMKGVADEMGRRLVINSSWGMYTFSTLDGTSLLSQAINRYSDQGIVFVTSGGNNGDENYHLQRTFASTDDTLKSIATYYSSGIGQGLIYWGESTGTEGNAKAVKAFNAGFALVSNADGSIHYSRMYNTRENLGFLDTFIVVNNDTIRYDIMVEDQNPLSGRPHVLLNVGRNNGYKLMMLCTGEEGSTVHVWNMANLSNGAGNMGCAFVNGGIFGCQEGNADYGIGEPACAEKTITVAAHSADFYDGNVCYPGEIAGFSSFGPTLDGRMKPEISAPGVNVVSSLSSYYETNGGYPAVYDAISSGRHYIWSRMSGTSMSSPAVSGIVALMLQANPNLTVDQIRDILFSTARNDDMTGPLQEMDSMSVRWGHGKVDALKAVNAAYDKLDIEQASTIEPELVVFPNPASGRVEILTGSDKAEEMQILSADGKTVHTVTVCGQASVDISQLPTGVYFVRVIDRNNIRMKKIVKL